MTALHRRPGNAFSPWPSRNISRKRRDGRDQGLNEVCRRKGVNYPRAELYLVCREADPGTAFALIEFQHEKAPEQDLTQPRYQAMIDLGDQTDVPVFALRYGGDLLRCRVTPLNQLARDLFPGQQTISSQEWMFFLSVVRKPEAPVYLFDLEGVLT